MPESYVEALIYRKWLKRTDSGVESKYCPYGPAGQAAIHSYPILMLQGEHFRSIQVSKEFKPCSIFIRRWWCQSSGRGVSLIIRTVCWGAYRNAWCGSPLASTRTPHASGFFIKTGVLPLLCPPLSSGCRCNDRPLHALMMSLRVVCARSPTPVCLSRAQSSGNWSPRTRCWRCAAGCTGGCWCWRLHWAVVF